MRFGGRFRSVPRTGMLTALVFLLHESPRRVAE